MKYLITTPDGKKYIKMHTKQVTIFTFERTLAMRFKSKSEANRFIMTAFGAGMVNEYVVVKEGI